MVTLNISHTALACVAAVMMATLVACAQDARPPEPAGPLRVRNAWARAADSGSTSGAYLTLVNTDTADVSIASFSTPIALLAQLHETTLRDGDEILVDRTPRPRRDGIHVVRAGDALLVKRLDTGRPGVIALVSDNPAYRTIELAPDEVEVIGRVVWKSGRL